MLVVDEEDVGSVRKNVHGGRSSRIYWFLVCKTMCRSKVIYLEARVIVWCEIMMKRLASYVVLFTRKERSVEAEARMRYRRER